MHLLLLNLCIIIALILAGCSSPLKIRLHNNSTNTAVLEFNDGKRVTLERGESKDFEFDYQFTQTVVIINGQKRKVQWRYPPREWMNNPESPSKFALEFADDGKIYALKIRPLDQVELPSFQPNGFPL